jgi:hypothetical protein
MEVDHTLVEPLHVCSSKRCPDVSLVRDPNTEAPRHLTHGNNEIVNNIALRYIILVELT